MNLPNSMTVGKSYSDYIRGDFDWTKDDEDDLCKGCDGFKTSDCCGAKCDPDLLLCHDCHEHCGTQCDECENKEKRETNKKNYENTKTFI